MLPTAKLIGEGDQLLREVDQMESELFSGLNPQEKKQLWDLEKKLIAQFAKME